MKTLTFKDNKIQIHQTKTHPFLIENSHLTDICVVFEHLINSTYNLNKYILKKTTILFILRVQATGQNVESLEFADFIEELD